MSPRLRSTILKLQYFRHKIKKKGSVAQWEGLWCPNDQPPVTAAAHPQRNCRCTVHKITAQISLFRPYKSHLASISIHHALSQPGPGCTGWSSTSAVSQTDRELLARRSPRNWGHLVGMLGLGRVPAPAARTGSAPEFYSAQPAMLPPLIAWVLPTADFDTHMICLKNL